MTSSDPLDKYGSIIRVGDLVEWSADSCRNQPYFGDKGVVTKIYGSTIVSKWDDDTWMHKNHMSCAPFDSYCHTVINNFSNITEPDESIYNDLI